MEKELEMEKRILKVLVVAVVAFLVCHWAAAAQTSKEQEEQAINEILQTCLRAGEAGEPVANVEAGEPGVNVVVAPPGGIGIESIKAVVKTADDAVVFATEYNGLVEAGVKGPDARLLALEAVRKKQDAAAKEQAAEGKGKVEGKQEAAEKKFLGIDWSMGVGASFDLGGRPRVASASVVERTSDANVTEKVVRVEEEQKAIPRIILEAHYFFKCRKAKNPDGSEISTEGMEKATCGHGPFVGIQSSDQKAIDSFAVGYLFGWRRDPDKTASFNLGLGLVMDPGVQVLGDGIEADQPLPDGESEVRFKKIDRLGVLVMASFSF